jgi:hypothetical protein
MQSEEIFTRTGRHRLDRRGFIHSTILPGAEQTLDDARENVQASMQLGGGKRRPLLVDIRQIKSQTREAREYYGGEESGACFSAAAVLVGSPVSRLLGNFFLGFNKSVHAPLKLFTSEEEAIEWLQTFLA